MGLLSKRRHVLFSEVTGRELASKALVKLELTSSSHCTEEYLEGDIGFLH